MADKFWLYTLPSMVLELEVARESHVPAEQQPGGTLTTTAVAVLVFDFAKHES